MLRSFVCSIPGCARNLPTSGRRELRDPVTTSGRDSLDVVMHPSGSYLGTLLA